jgi:hypothetical protein
MKVKELIQELNLLPQDADVVIYDYLKDEQIRGGDDDALSIGIHELQKDNIATFSEGKKNTTVAFLYKNEDYNIEELDKK